MKKLLFYTFLAIFAVTAIVTLSGLIEEIPINIKDKYLELLVGAFLLEIGGAILLVFKRAEFFGNKTAKNSSRVDVVMLPRKSFPQGLDPHDCEITFLNTATTDQRKKKVKTVRTNGYLSALVDDLSRDEWLQVKVTNKDGSIWKSEYFDPVLAKAELKEAP